MREGIASAAQLIKRWTCKPVVPGSNPGVLSSDLVFPFTAHCLVKNCIVSNGETPFGNRPFIKKAPGMVTLATLTHIKIIIKSLYH